MADIGEKLRSARKAKGMSIEDIERITKIQRRYLSALENNDFEQLPGDFYVRAFIKQYAQVVDLDGNELLNDFHSEVPESKPEEYVENSIDNKSQEVRRTTNNKKGLWKAYLPKAATIIGIFLVIFVVYLVYTHFFANGSQQNANEADNVTVSSSVESSSKKVTKKVSAKSNIKLSEISENSYRVLDFSKAKNRDLKLAAGETSTWAQVTVDGQVVWQGNLSADKSHVVKLAKNVKRVSVQFGNSHANKITLAGHRVRVHSSENLNAPMTVNFVFGQEVKTENSSTDNSASDSTVNNSTTSQNNSVNQSQNSQPQNNQTQTRPNQNQGQTTSSSQNQVPSNNQGQQTGQTGQGNGNATEGEENNGGQSR